MKVKINKENVKVLFTGCKKEKCEAVLTSRKKFYCTYGFEHKIYFW